MAVARQQPATRISGDVSAGVATTTDRFKPSGPRLSSTNSLTSRPRSPTSPTTTTSASVKRVIMPRSVLFPTPDPANRPILCPLPMVMRLLIARMPTSSGCAMLCRAMGLMLTPRSGTVEPVNGAKPSSGLPAPSIIRPSRCSPTVTVSPSPSSVTLAPGVRPVDAPSHIKISNSPSKPTTSATMPWR